MQTPPKIQTRARKAICQRKKQRPKKRKYRYRPNQTPKTPPNYRNPTRKHLLLQIQTIGQTETKHQTQPTPTRNHQPKRTKKSNTKTEDRPASPLLDHKQLQKTERDKA